MNNGDIPADTPLEVQEQARQEPRVPCFDPTVGVPLVPPSGPTPTNRLVVIGDSIAHGFQSGAIFNTDISFPAIIAYELGCLDSFHYPRYGGPGGGLPVNIEYLLRDLEHHFGSTTSVWELPFALFRARSFLDTVEDYWERGKGSEPPQLAGYMHDLAVYGWDLRDALSRSAASCRARIATPRDNFFNEIVENNGERAALRVYPTWPDPSSPMTLFDVAAALGDDHDADSDCGVETLIIELGANNALDTVVSLQVRWSGAGYQDLDQKSAYNLWTPDHFRTELAAVAAEVRKVKARHVIWCTVPHVTIPPVSRGVGTKQQTGSPYFPFYTRPWLDDAHFNANRDPHLTGTEAQLIDTTIDIYNNAIQELVRDARSGADGPARDWYLFDLAGLLERLATRRYIEDPNARPPWWTPYPLPPQVAALQPTPDTHFLTSDGAGGRATGGLFALDGVHPTTVGYGLIAQELISIMQRAGVAIRPDASPAVPATVDFDRLIRRDSLINNPPQNIDSTLQIIGWADEALGLIKRALHFKPDPA